LSFDHSYNNVSIFQKTAEIHLRNNAWNSAGAE